jgi:hypothetical protein
MLIRLRQFGATHGQRFPETSRAHAAFVVIAAEIARLEALDVAERSASRGRRAARKDAARKVLADSLTRAGFTARVVAKTHPALEASIDLPLPASDLRMLTVGRQFVAAAAPCADEFAAHGIPIPEVEACVAAFDQARHERGMRHDDHVRARAEIAASFSRAMDAVAVLDVNVANCLASETVVQAVWKYDRRLTAPQRSHDADEPVSTTVPDQPVASANAPLTATSVINHEAARNAPIRARTGNEQRDSSRPGSTAWMTLRAGAHQSLAFEFEQRLPSHGFRDQGECFKDVREVRIGQAVEPADDGMQLGILRHFVHGPLRGRERLRQQMQPGERAVP